MTHQRRRGVEEGAAAPTEADEVIAEYIVAQESGQPMDREQLLRDYPHLAEELTEFFADQERLEQIARPLGGEPPPPPVSVRYFGDYELLEEVAQGGMGVVYKAIQKSLQRTVAVKMILRGHLASNGDVKRFQDEARTAANLRHPGIVPIYEVGQFHGRHYFSMDYIEGSNLAERLRHDPPSREEAVRIVQTLAETVDYAHRQGTVHRDLKPSNVLIDRSGGVHVTDFGLAMRVEDAPSHTRTGQVMGTPSYMSPEQASAKRDLVGPASDIYSLGAILYELLCGRPPFRGETAAEIIHLVAASDPLPPRRLSPGLPRDLETICMKCLEKEPHRRYGTAALLAEDLRRFESGEAIRARPVGRLEWTARWCRREPTLTLMSAALVLAMAAGISLVVWQWRRAERNAELAAEKSRAQSTARRDADAARKQTETALLEVEARRSEAVESAALASRLAESESRARRSVRRYLYVANMNLAQQAWEKGDVERMIRLLARHRPDEDSGADLRGLEWRHLVHQAMPRPFVVVRDNLGSGAQMTISHDGRWLASGRGRGRGVSLFHQTSGSYVHHHLPRAASFAFFPDRPLGVSSSASSVHVRDLVSGEFQRSLATPSRVTCVAAARSMIASGHADGSVRIWDLPRNATPALLTGHDGPVNSLAFHPDGTRLASGGDDRTVRLWSVAESRQEVKFADHQGVVNSVAFSADGELLASGGADRVLVVRSVSSLTVKYRDALHQDTITVVCFSPDGKKLATAGKDRVIAVRQAASGNLLRRLKGHRSHPTGLAFGAGGRILFSRAADATLKWVLGDLAPSAVRLRDKSDAVRFALDGKALLLAGPSGLQMIDVATGQLLGALSREELPHDASFVHCDRDGRTVLVGQQARSERPTPVLALWRDDHFETRPLEIPAALAAVSPNGRWLALGNNHGNHGVVLASLDEHGRLESIQEAPLKQGVKSLRFSPDSEQLVATFYRHAAVWDVRAARELFQIEVASSTRPRSKMRAAFFASDGNLIVTESNGRISVWDTISQTRRTVVLSKGQSARRWPDRLRGEQDGIAVSLDGRLLATSTPGGEIELWDLTTGDRRGEMSGHNGAVHKLVFTRDGETLISSGGDGVVRLWDIQTQEPKAEWTGHAGGVNGLTVAPDESALASISGSSREVILWRAGGKDWDLEQELRSTKTLSFEPVTESVDALMDWLSDETVGAKAVNALCQKGPAVVPRAIRALDSDDAARRHGAALVLSRLAPAARSPQLAAALGAALADPDTQVRRAAQVGLMRLDSLGVSQFRRHIGQADDEAQLLALQGLGALGRHAQGATDEIRRACDHSNPHIVLAAADALAQIAPASDAAGKALRSGAAARVLQIGRESSGSRLRAAAAGTLGRLRSPTTPAVQWLASLLSRPSNSTQKQALRSLARLGADASDAFEDVLAVATDSPSQERLLARHALFQIDAARAVQSGWADPDAMGDVRADIAELDVGPGDWPQWGGSGRRNNAPGAKGLPTRWACGDDELPLRWESYQGKLRQNPQWSPDRAPRPAGSSHVRWAVPIGSQVYGNPTVANGKVFIGANNGSGYLRRFPAELDMGVILCFEERTGKFLWQHSIPKLPSGRVNDWPLQGAPTTPLADGDRIWVTTNRCEVVCLDADGFHDGRNDGVFQDEDNENLDEADVIWKLDMIAQWNVFPHNMSHCSLTTDGSRLFVSTSNGVDEGHIKVPRPTAPSFICLDRDSGAVLWTDNSPGGNILHGQWASPSYAVIAGQPQVIFPGGDGWLYSFDPQGDGRGGAKLLWKFDCNPKDSEWELGGAGTRNSLIGFACICEDRVYIHVGQDPEHGEGLGHLWCLDPTRKSDGSDVSAELVVDAEGRRVPHRRYRAVEPDRGERVIPNPDSAVVWHLGGESQDMKDPPYEDVMHRSLSTPVVKNGLLYTADLGGAFHCIDAQTGNQLWGHDLFAACWGSALVADGKVYLGDEDGHVSIFRHARSRQEAMVADSDGDWRPWKKIEMNNSIYSTPIVANGVLYIADRSTLYAISPVADARN